MLEAGLNWRRIESFSGWLWSERRFACNMLMMLICSLLLFIVDVPEAGSSRKCYQTCLLCIMLLLLKMWNEVLFPLAINRYEARFYFPLAIHIKCVQSKNSSLFISYVFWECVAFHVKYKVKCTDAIIFSLIKYEAITVVVFLFRKRLECFKYLTLLVSVGNWLSVAVMHYIYLAVSIFHCLSFIQALFLHHSISIALMLVRKHFMNKHFF